MNTDLTSPCSNCPFRKDIRPYLNKKRARDLTNQLLEHDRSFTCHKTSASLNKDKFESDEQHCAGAMILLEKHNRPNQWMRLSERLGFYKRSELKMDSPVFDTFKDFIKAQQA